MKEEVKGSSGMKTDIQELWNAKDIRTRLIGILSSEKIEAGARILTPEFARLFNEDLGKYLRDDVSIGALVLPPKNIDARVGGIGLAFQRQYNRFLSSLRFARYRTVGSLRAADVFDLKRTSRIGPKTIAFVQTAFARPQAGK